MKKSLAVSMIAALAVLVMLPAAQAQKYQSTPVDLSNFWNADGWQNDLTANDGDTPTTPTNHSSAAGSIWTLDNGDARVRVTSIPDEIIPGQMNVTEDGEVAFLLPDMTPFKLDVYYVDGSTIPVPPGKYKYVYLACMSGNGTWPGAISDWAADVDPDTGEVYDAREEANSFKPIYQEGAGNWIPVGIVNDWFWSPPEWVAPESGDASEIISDYMTYEGDPDYFLYFVDGQNMGNHDYGQYTYVNGAGYFIYSIPVPQGLTSATLYTEMWGNVKMSISTGDFADASSYVEVFNSVTSDKAYASGGDGYEPNRKIRSHDVSQFLTGNIAELLIKFEDAAPDQVNTEGAADAWGPRVHQMGLYTGPTIKTRLGERLWPGLVRTDGNSPTGGLILIKKKYALDETKTLTSLVMPNNIPRSDPILSIFAITLANETAEVGEFMLY